MLERLTILIDRPFGVNPEEMIEFLTNAVNSYGGGLARDDPFFGHSKVTASQIFSHGETDLFANIKVAVPRVIKLAKERMSKEKNLRIYKMGREVDDKTAKLEAGVEAELEAGIEHNVDIPQGGRNWQKSVLPVYAQAAKMKIGDCVTTPYTRSPIASNLARLTGFRFTQRRIKDELRIWRIA